VEKRNPAWNPVSSVRRALVPIAFTDTMYLPTALVLAPRNPPNLAWPFWRVNVSLPSNSVAIVIPANQKLKP
jgi:hypothetical protein